MPSIYSGSTFEENRGRLRLAGEMENVVSTIETVIDNGLCVGCGGCGAATNGRIPIRLTTRGTYVADVSDASDADKEIGSRVCPFADESKNENEIADEVFDDKVAVDARTGRYMGLYAGRIKDDSAITGSSSGGLTSWFINELLQREEVDGVIHVGATGTPLFGYVVSYSIDEVLGRRKSQYYPASFAKTVLSIRGDGKRYAIVGVPCAMRSARLVANEDLILKEQLAYFVGIVCGHMKSAAYGESFAWQLGVPPDDVQSVDFRIKDPALTSRQYSFGAQARSDGQWKTAQTLSLVGGNWGHAVFQLDACNFCDDVFAETADIVFGDAWLSKYEIDWRGTNVVITRNEIANQIVTEGVAREAIGADVLDIDTVASTQAGNFRHRHEGLAVRLADDQAAGKWTPRKRIKAGYSGVSDDRINLIRQRRELSVRSHEMFAEAKSAGDLQIYLGAIRPLIESYGRATKHSFSTRLRNKLQREFWKIVRKIRR